MHFHEDGGLVVKSQRESLLINGQNAGGTGLHHLNLDPFLQAKLVEPHDELGRPVHVVDCPVFTCRHQFERNKLHLARQCQDTDTQSQLCGEF